MTITCAVVNCTNNSYKLSKWGYKNCETHNILQKDCVCQWPFELRTFPSAATEPALREQWIQQIHRKDTSSKYKRWEPNRDSRVCSHHFVPGATIPTLNLGYDAKRVKERRTPRRRALNTIEQRSNEETTASASVLHRYVIQKRPSVYTPASQVLPPPPAQPPSLSPAPSPSQAHIEQRRNKERTTSASVLHPAVSRPIVYTPASKILPPPPAQPPSLSPAPSPSPSQAHIEQRRNKERTTSASVLHPAVSRPIVYTPASRILPPPPAQPPSLSPAPSPRQVLVRTTRQRRKRRKRKPTTSFLVLQPNVTQKQLESHTPAATLPPPAAFEVVVGTTEQRRKRKMNASPLVFHLDLTQQEPSCDTRARPPSPPGPDHEYAFTFPCLASDLCACCAEKDKIIMQLKSSVVALSEDLAHAEDQLHIARENAVKHNGNQESRPKPVKVNRQCDKVFSTRNALKKHVVQAYRKHQKRNNCVAPSEKEEGEELTTVDGRQCRQCNKVFSTRHVLKKHVVEVHQKARPHVCEYCAKAFSQMRNLELHMNIHKGVKPFSCQSCETRFSSRQALNNHQKRKRCLLKVASRATPPEVEEDYRAGRQMTGVRLQTDLQTKLKEKISKRLKLNT